MSARAKRFNPHTHEGCDFAYRAIFSCALVSIHTPTKGVTVKIFGLPVSLPVSIHTPTKGVTDHTLKVIATRSVSIHTPTKGVTALGG